MIEQSILKALSGKSTSAPEGANPAKAADAAPAAQDFAAIMLARQDLEGELLGADVGKPITGEDGKDLPESGKTLPDAPPLDAGEGADEGAGEAMAMPAGLAALARLPELPSYRDIPILPPQRGQLFAEQAKAPPPQPVPQSSQATVQAQAQAPAQPQMSPPADAMAQPQANATAATAARAGDVQMVVAQAPAFSATLEKQAASTAPAAQEPRERPSPQDVPSAKSLLSLYGKTQEKPAPQPASTSPASPPSPSITTTLSPPAASAAQAQAQAPAPAASAMASPTPHSIETLVERLVQTRESALSSSARLSVANSDFGTVSLRFDNNAAGLSVSMTNADPEFAATARTALAERIVAAGETARGDSGQTRSDSNGQPSSQGQSAAQSQSHSQSQHNGAPKQDQFHADGSPDANRQGPAETHSSQSARQTDNPADSGLYI